MAPPHLASGVSVGSGSAAAGNQFRCPTCQKALKTNESLTQHQLTHQKPHTCDNCDETFARLDQLKVHKNSKHGLNTSSFICFMDRCTRRRLGLKDEFSLIQHLAKTHQGATLRDNDRALAAAYGVDLDAQSDNASSMEDDSMSIDEEGRILFGDNDLPEELMSTKAETSDSGAEDPTPAEDEVDSKKTPGQPQANTGRHGLHTDDVQKEYLAKLRELKRIAMTGTSEKIVEKIEEIEKIQNEYHV